MNSETIDAVKSMLEKFMTTKHGEYMPSLFELDSLQTLLNSCIPIDQDNEDTITDEEFKRLFDIIDCTKDHCNLTDELIFARLYNHYQATKELRRRSVEDELPESGQEVLFLRNGRWSRGWFDDYNNAREGIYDFFSDLSQQPVPRQSVIEWMSLPPTKGDE